VQALTLGPGAGRGLEILCLGAHADDLEIGCGGTVLALLQAPRPVAVHWVVFSAPGERASEAHHGAALFLQAAATREVCVMDFRDGFFPFQGGTLKERFEELKGRLAPDLILTHCRHDRHQDHRLVSELTWSTFRHHLILEYEIPKYDGDLGAPNCYVPLDDALCRRKTQYLMTAFPSQQAKAWFTEDTFRGLMRLRGVEARAPEGFAEAFYGHKLVLQP